MTTGDITENMANQQAAKKKPYHHGDLRAALVQATRELVEAKGAAHFSVAQAARQAGVSSAAPYRHFRDREEMLDAVAEDGLNRLAAAFAEAAAPLPKGSLQAITTLGRTYIAFAQREPSVFRLMFAEHQEKSEATCEAGDACKMHLLRQVAAHMGVEEPDEQVLYEAFPLWAMVHGIAFLYIDQKIGPDNLDIDMEVVLQAATQRLMAR